MRRRDLFGFVLAGAAASLLRPLRRALADQPKGDDYFVFIHAAGGWDVTLWADPRNERRGIVEPASTDNTDPGGVAHWKYAPLDADTRTFEIVTPASSSLRLGPAIGDLYDLHDRLTIVNGIAMNTVSHEDGTAYATTGRHRTGGVLPESSIDVLVASELGTAQLMPDVSIRYPSAFVGGRVDRRAIPLRVQSVDAITKSFVRSGEYLDAADRQQLAGLLADEAHALAARSTAPQPYEQLAEQAATMPRLLAGEFTTAFSTRALQAAYPTLPHGSRTQGPGAAAAAFAVEAFRRDVVRCASFGLGGLDTHTSNYKLHARTLQDQFAVIAALVKLLDTTPHPNRAGAKLGDHTHVLVVSEFCRTPQINPAGGRDHYPNNSALVISPRFRRGQFGATDRDQLLPREFGTFSDGKRALGPADLLATFLGAFGIDPRRHMRDGEVVKELLA